MSVISRRSKQITLLLGDCLVVMPTLTKGSVDLILADLPYGSTAGKWDVIIPFEQLWDCYRQVLKPNGVVVLTATQPFTSQLVMSNFDWFKYAWVWVKNRPTGLHQSKNRPMSKHEDIVVFSPGSMGHTSLLEESKRMPYTPVGARTTKSKTVKAKGFHGRHVGARPNQIGTEYVAQTNLPDTILYFDKDEDHLHAAQKPVALLEYLIHTYTNGGALVLDNTMGSGSTGVACVNTSRRFIGVEKEVEYFDIAHKRIWKLTESINVVRPTLFE